MTAHGGVLRRLSLVVGVTAMILVTGCSSSKTRSDDDGMSTSSLADENTGLGDSDTGRAMGLETVHFPFDSFLFDDLSIDLFWVL